MSQLKFVPLSQIRANPVALRDANLKSESFSELLDSVKSEGVILAISLREKPGEDGKTYELVDGLQRFTAACMAGTGVKGDLGADGQGIIPAQIMERSDAEALMTQIVSNAHKVETKPVEYAKAILRLLGYNPTWTESDLATKLSKSPAWIGKQLGLVKLAEAIQPHVDEGRVVLANAYGLAKLPQDEQASWLDRAMTMNANEFGPAVLARVKEIKDANRAGQAVAEEHFVPTAHLRNKKEIEATLSSRQELSALISAAGISDPVDAAEYVLKWTLNLDNSSVKDQEEKYNARKKQQEDEKARRTAERAAKRQKETDEAAKEAAAAAVEAAEAAKARGVEVATA